MRTIPFGLRPRERSYVPRTLRLSGALSLAMVEALNDSVDRRHFSGRRKSSTDVDRVLKSAFGAARLFDQGRDGFNTKALSWTADTQKALLLDPTTNGTWLKALTSGGATNASPIVYNITAHGFSNNDLVVAFGILGNLSANQSGLVTGAATNSFNLTTLEGQTIAGSGAYTSGGYVVNLTQAKYVSDILGNRVGTDQTLTGTSSSKGVANATSPITWPAVPVGNAAYAVVFYDAAGGTDSTNRLIAWQDGKIRVITVGNSAAAATTIACQPLRAQLWDGVTGTAPVLWFSNGYSATLAAAALQGADSLTVTALGHAIPDLSTADVTSFGAGLPVTPSGGSIAFTVGSIYAPLTPTGIYQL